MHHHTAKQWKQGVIGRQAFGEHWVEYIDFMSDGAGCGSCITQELESLQSFDKLNPQNKHGTGFKTELSKREFPMLIQLLRRYEKSTTHEIFVPYVRELYKTATTKKKKKKIRSDNGAAASIDSRLWSVSKQSDSRILESLEDHHIRSASSVYLDDLMRMFISESSTFTFLCIEYAQISKRACYVRIYKLGTLRASSPCISLANRMPHGTVLENGRRMTCAYISIAIESLLEERLERFVGENPFNVVVGGGGSSSSSIHTKEKDDIDDDNNSSSEDEWTLNKTTVSNIAIAKPQDIAGLISAGAAITTSSTSTQPNNTSQLATYKTTPDDYIYLFEFVARGHKVVSDNSGVCESINVADDLRKYLVPLASYYREITAFSEPQKDDTTTTTAIVFASVYHQHFRSYIASSEMREKKKILIHLVLITLAAHMDATDAVARRKFTAIADYFTSIHASITRLDLQALKSTQDLLLNLALNHVSLDLDASFASIDNSYVSRLCDLQSRRMARMLEYATVPKLSENPLFSLISQLLVELFSFSVVDKRDFTF